MRAKMGSNNSSVVASSMMFLMLMFCSCCDICCGWDLLVGWECNLLVCGDWDLPLDCVCLVSVDSSWDGSGGDEWVSLSDNVVLESVEGMRLLLLCLVSVNVQVTCIVRFTVFGLARVANIIVSVVFVTV